MKTIDIDGVKYTPVQDFGPIKIVVLDGGFVYAGHYEKLSGDEIRITSARCLIRWGSSKHLGELINGPLENTKLGDPCVVTANASQVKHLIEVNSDEWTKHC